MNHCALTLGQALALVVYLRAPLDDNTVPARAEARELKLRELLAETLSCMPLSLSVISLRVSVFVSDLLCVSRSVIFFAVPCITCILELPSLPFSLASPSQPSLSVEKLE